MRKATTPPAPTAPPSAAPTQLVRVADEDRERMFVFASAEAVHADDAYVMCWEKLQRRMLDVGGVTLVDMTQQTAVIMRPVEGINPETLTPQVENHPHILITLHATIYTDEPLREVPAE